MSITPYSKSIPNIVVQHKDKHFMSGGLTLATVGCPMIVTENIEGDSYAAVFEFKVEKFAFNQTLANMLCVAADGSVSILKSRETK